MSNWAEKAVDQFASPLFRRVGGAKAEESLFWCLTWWRAPRRPLVAAYRSASVQLASLCRHTKRYERRQPQPSEPTPPPLQAWASRTAKSRQACCHWSTSRGPPTGCFCCCAGPTVAVLALRLPKVVRWPCHGYEEGRQRYMNMSALRISALL